MENTYDGVLKNAKERMTKAFEVVKKEFTTIRTGRASTSLLDTIKVEYYGSHVPLKQLAGITTPDPKLLLIQPFDPTSMEAIEKAILQSDLGLMPNNDGKVIRIGIPDLSEERRKDLDKLIKKMAEEGRIAIRAVRRDANDHMKKIEKDKIVTEDQSETGLEMIQKYTDDLIKEIDALLKKKEQEIFEV